MPPKDRKGTRTPRSGTSDTNTSPSRRRLSSSLARQVVLREASKIAQADQQPHSTPPPVTAQQAGNALAGETKKGKQAPRENEASSYLARAGTEDEALGRSPASNTSLERADEDDAGLSISMHSRTVSLRDSLLHQNATLKAPRQSPEDVSDDVVATPEKMRKLHHDEQFRVIQNWRNYVDVPLAGRERVEQDLRSGLISVVEQKLALFHAEHMVEMALKDHDILIQQAQYELDSEFSSRVETLLRNARRCADPHMLPKDSQDDAGLCMAGYIMALTRIYQELRADNGALLVQAHEWRFLESWIENKAERLEYHIGDIPKEFDEMYISARILKEGACYVHEQLVELKHTWNNTVKNMKATAEKVGVSLGQTGESDLLRRWLKHVPTGYYDFYRMGSADIRRSCLEGHGDPRFPWSLESCLKSLALRAKSMHEVRNDIEAFKMKCQEAFDEAEEGDWSASDSEQPN